MYTTWAADYSQMGPYASGILAGWSQTDKSGDPTWMYFSSNCDSSNYFPALYCYSNYC